MIKRDDKCENEYEQAFQVNIFFWSTYLKLDRIVLYFIDIFYHTPQE